MTITLYELSAPLFVRNMGYLAGALDKASVFIAEREIAEDVLMGLRIYPDMYPFSMQVRLVATIATLGVAKLAAVEQPDDQAEDTSFSALRNRVNRAADFASGVDPALFSGAHERPISLVNRRGERMEFTGRKFLVEFILPNFFFHYATAYDILRSIGVPVGKRDFMGSPGLVK